MTTTFFVMIRICIFDFSLYRAAYLIESAFFIGTIKENPGNGSGIFSKMFTYNSAGCLRGCQSQMIDALRN